MSVHHYLSYTYRLEWTHLNKSYYGVRTGNKIHPIDDLWHIYRSSSDVVKEYVRKYGDPNIIEVDRIFYNLEKAKLYETQYLTDHDAANSDDWLNKANGTPSMSGKKHSKQSKYKIRISNGKKIKLDNVIYNSYREAAEKLNITHATVSRWINHSKPTKESKSQKLSNILKGNKFASKKIKINGITYNSMTEAAKELNVSNSTISRWVNNGKPNKEKTRRKLRKLFEKKIEINEIVYNSMTEAAKELNVSNSTIGRWVKNKKAKNI